MQRTHRFVLRGVLGLTLASASAAGAAPASEWTFDWSGRAEVDAEGLRSDDPAKRLDAVNALGNYDVSLTQAHLLRALRDRDDKVRLAAARALGAGGATAAVPTMIDWLADADPKVKQVAAAALGDIGGREATAALVRTLGDVDAAVRTVAVRALGAIGKRGDRGVVISLIPRLEDDPHGKAEVKLAAIAELEALGDRRAVIPLVARFSDISMAVRTSAVRAVGVLGDPSAVPALTRLVGDPAEDVRTAAVGALGALGAVDAIDVLTEQLTTGGDTFRAKVAYALGQIAGQPNAGKAGELALRTLVAQLAGPPAQRKAAHAALQVAGVAAVPALVAHLQGRIAGDPATAVELLESAADPRATATLAGELERGRIATPSVLRALGATRDPQALVPVLRALASKDRAIRLAAMEALRPLIGADARAGDVLIARLADEDLEVRVLAAEYLGTLRVAAAAPALIQLAGPEAPRRLRRAAIDALGAIGDAAATPTLIGVLRDGPPELHRDAATALAYIADPSALAFLQAQARTDRGRTRPEVVRALGATLRGRPDPAARTLLVELAGDAPLRVSLAAIGGLAAAGDPADVPALRTLLERATADRRRAAAAALGALRTPAALDPLAAALAGRDDRLLGDVAWAIGEVLAAHPADARAPALVDRLLHHAKFGGWATAIDASGALARVLAATPVAARATLVTAPRRSALIALAAHRSRLVRINVAHALGAIAADAADDPVVRALQPLARDDVSPRVRIAALRALARQPRAAAVIAQLATRDPDPGVREAARALAKPATAAPVSPAGRSEWRTFYVVDPGADDAPVRQEPYFVHTADGLVWASYTDARGQLDSEHVPAGDATIAPASRESEY